MLPAVQAFPEDRLVHIEVYYGHCILVVWAYHVLGLTTVVRIREGEEVRFGDGEERVLIQSKDKQPADWSISLLDSKGGDVLLRLQEAQDGFEIDAASKMPVQGYGRLFLSEACLHESVQGEMELVVLGYSIHVSKYLSRIRANDPLLMNMDRLVRAAQLLFANPRLTAETVRPYVACYAPSITIDSLDPPATVAAFCHRNDRSVASYWKTLTSGFRLLVVLLLSLAHVRDLESCAQLPLRQAGSLFGHPLVNDLTAWDGKTRILVHDDVWFRVIAMLLLGQSVFGDPLLDTASLRSGRGWSVYLSTFGMDDPTLIEPGAIGVTTGVPVRNEVRKRGVVDGPRSGHMSESDIWSLSAPGPLMVSVESADRVEVLPMQCAEQKNYFVVNLRLLHTTAAGKQSVVRSGFRELHRCLWRSVSVPPCSHSDNAAAMIALPPASVAVTGFATLRSLWDSEQFRILIFLTAHNSAARWRALTNFNNGSGYSVFVRAEGYCFTCAMDQTALANGRSILIL